MKNLLSISKVVRQLENLPRYSKQAVLEATSDLRSLAQGFIYRYPRPALTVDAVIFGIDDEDLKLLLIKRRNEPFKDCWALPGGFLDVDKDVDADEAVARELEEETSLKDIYLEQLYTFSKEGRDPRERVVSVAYYGLVKPEMLKPVAGDDAKDVRWFSVDDLPKLAFDHQDVVEMGLNRLRSKVRYQPIGFELLPLTFTLGELQRLYESVLQTEIDKRNFRRKIEATGVLKRMKNPKKVRPQYYQFDREAYQRLVASGFNFEL